MSERIGSEVPPFSEAVKQLQQFLVGQQLSPELWWVFREDVTANKQRILIKEPLPTENQRIAEALYERGCQRGLGIRLEILCLFESRPCCYVWLPKDELEAENSLMLMSRFIISIPTALPLARGVKNGLLWRICRWIDKQSGWNGMAERVPHRNI